MKTNQYPSFFPAFNQFGNMLDEIFQAVDTAGGQLFNTGLPPANIHETETNFQLELAAPGLNKSDFKIEIERKKNLSKLTKSILERNLVTSNSKDLTSCLNL